MHDASAALQKALVARLKANVPLVAGRVFDATPMSVQFPYVQIGHSHALPDDAECINGATCTITLDTWSRAVGAVETRRIAAEVVAAVDDWEPNLSADGLAVVEIRCTGSRTVDDPDGKTTHGILTIEAQTERV